MSPQTTSHISADVIIIGGGFGGCYALHQLREAGYSVKLIEAGSDFGGVWHFNRYPGARVDSEVPLYQLSLPQAWRSFQFSERFPGHVELRQYFTHIADALDLRKDAIFNSRVTSARFDNDSNTWSISTENSITASARYVVFATGTTNMPYIPAFPGLDTYSGQVIHPAAWPEDLDVKGKKIGIIGQGASGLQIFQELAKEDTDITIFVRNPPTAMPMAQRALSRREAEEQKNLYEALFNYAKDVSPSGYAYSACHKSFYDAPPEERQRQHEELWARGTYAALTSNYPEVSFDKKANAELYEFWAKSVRSRISDPVKREIMAPAEQFQWIGAKRPNLETDYYEMIDKPHVKLVSLKSNSIRRFTQDGIVTGSDDGGETAHDLDIVIVATGYDSVTGSLYAMNVTGTDNVLLQDKWKDGIKNYLGMLAPGFPNALMLYGPQAPSGLVNGPPFLELQVDWVIEFLKGVAIEGATRFEVKEDPAREYAQQNKDAYNHSLMKETASWWNGSNIPGKVQEPLFWVKGLQAWRQETERALSDWSRFVLE